MDDDFGVESLQGKNWQYCIKQKLNFSKNYNLLQQQLNDGINSRGNKNRKRLDDTRENVTICKECYLSTFLNIDTNFHRFLEAIREQEREKCKMICGTKTILLKIQAT